MSQPFTEVADIGRGQVLYIYLAQQFHAADVLSDWTEHFVPGNHVLASELLSSEGVLLRPARCVMPNSAHNKSICVSALLLAGLSRLVRHCGRHLMRYRKYPGLSPDKGLGHRQEHRCNLSRLLHSQSSQRAEGRYLTDGDKCLSTTSLQGYLWVVR